MTLHLFKPKQLVFLFAILLLSISVKAQAPQPTNVTISVNGVISSQVNYCAGTTLVLEANASCPFASGSSLFSFTWIGGPGTVTAFNKFSINPTANTTYTVTATPTFTLSSASCAPASTIIYVKYIGGLLNVSQIPSTICANDGVTFSLNNIPGPNNSYTIGWQTSIDQGYSTTLGNPAGQFTGMVGGT